MNFKYKQMPKWIKENEELRETIEHRRIGFEKFYKRDAGDKFIDTLKSEEFKEYMIPLNYVSPIKLKKIAEVEERLKERKKTLKKPRKIDLDSSSSESEEEKPKKKGTKAKPRKVVLDSSSESEEEKPKKPRGRPKKQ